MSSIMMMVMLLGVLLSVRLDVAAGLKCYVCSTDLAKPTVQYKGDVCIARDGRSLLDANAKGATDCPDGQFCGTQYEWTETQLDPAIPYNRTVKFSRGCFPSIPLTTKMTGGQSYYTPQSMFPNMGNNSFMNQNYTTYWRAMCSADYCNAHFFGNIYMGIIDGTDWSPPSHGVQMAVSTFLPLSVTLLAYVVSKY